MFKTTVLLALLTELLAAIGGFFGGIKGMIFMFIISIIINFISYWFSDKMVLKMYGAREVTAGQAPDLVRMVSGLAQRAKMPMPRVYIIDTEIPNAFATGRDPEHGVVAVTTGIMHLLTFDELQGVVAHELAHIKHRDTLVSTIVATLAGVITMIANIAQWAGGGRNNDNEGGGMASFIEMILMIILAPLATTLIQLAISRTREYEADETGGIMAGNPKSLASVLKKIEYCARNSELPAATPATSHLFIINPFSGAGSWITSLFSTHPPTEQRVTC